MRMLLVSGCALALTSAFAGCTAVPVKEPGNQKREIAAAWGKSPLPYPRDDVADLPARDLQGEAGANLAQMVLDQPENYPRNARTFAWLSRTLRNTPAPKEMPFPVLQAKTNFLQLLHRYDEADALLDAYAKAHPGTKLPGHLAFPDPIPYSEHEFLVKARAAARRFEIAEAESWLEQAMNAGSPNSQLATVGGLIYRQRGEPGMASELFDRATRVGANFPEPYQYMAEQAADRGSWELAEYLYAIALRYDSGHVASLLGHARARARVLGPQAAIAHYKKLVELEPGRPELQLALAEAYLRAQQPGSAKDALQSAIRASPRQKESFLMLGDLTKLEGDSLADYAAKRHSYRYALASYEMASMVDPENPEGLYRTAELYFGIGDLQAAEKNFKAALKLAPRWPGAHLRLAQLERNGGRKNEAIALLEREIALNPRPDAAWVERGNIAMADKDFALASRCFGEAYRLNPRNADALFGDGVVKHLEGDYVAALAIFRHTLAEDPARTDVHWQMGLIYQKAGQAAEAREAFGAYMAVTREPAARQKAQDKLEQLP